MNNNKIALYIGGTKLRQAGYSDLVILGLFPAAEFNNMDRVTLISEKPVFVIKHTNDYILYQLIDRKVKSFDAETNGVLSIAIAIPANMQFATGQSPYTLLTDVYKEFRSNFMTPYSDGRDCFLDVPADEDLFKQIVDRYSLEPRTGKYVAMGNGITGTLAVPQDKMNELFSDTQYNEFLAFKDIEIGTMCQSSPGLETLVIPRPVSYRVFVNDQLAPEELYIKDKLVQTNVPNGENISFTLAQLEAAPDFTIKQGKSEVMLDKANEKIICRIAKKDILYRCSIYVKGSASPSNKEAVKRAILDGLIKVTETKTGFNIMDYQREGLNFEISSSKMVSKVFELDKMKYNGMGLAIRSETNPQEQTINISIDVTEAEPTLPVKTGKKDKTPQGTATRRAKGGNNQPDGTIYDEAKFLKEVNNAVKEREEELNAEWEKRLSNGKRKSLLGGLAAGVAICLLAFGAYFYFIHPTLIEKAKNEAKEKINKEYNNNPQQAELTDDDKEKIFNELLNTKIHNNELELIEKLKEHIDEDKTILDSKIVKDFLAEIENLDTEDLQKSKEVKTIVEKYNKKQSTAKATTSSSKTAKDSNAADAEKTVEATLEKARKENARAELLELVKEKKYNKFLNHEQMTYVLSMEERVAVENVLNYANRNFKKDFKNKNRYNSSTLKNAIKSEVYNKVFDGREITWDLLIRASKEIQRMVGNLDNNDDIMKNANPL